MYGFLNMIALPNPFVQTLMFSLFQIPLSLPLKYILEKPDNLVYFLILNAVLFLLSNLINFFHSIVTVAFLLNR